MTRHRNDFFFWTINSFYNFFSRSTQCWEKLKETVPLVLKAEAETRWSSRTEAVKPIELYLKKIVVLLENMVEDGRQTIDTQERWTTNTKSYSDKQLYDTDKVLEKATYTVPIDRVQNDYRIKQ